MSRLLRLGSRGPDVSEVQSALNRAGGSRLPPLGADGIFGQKTHARVQEFQRSKGLAVDGIVGPMTRRALGLPAGAVPVPVPGGGGGGSGQTDDVVAKVVSATKSAHSTWRASATFHGVTIMASTAIGNAGCLSGPNLGPLIQGISASIGPNGHIAKAAADGIGASFASFQGGVTIAALPWYPSFASVPLPAAPPTPNIPTPLAASSTNSGAITSSGVLQSAMSGRLAVPVPGADAKFAAIASQVAAYFSSWLAGAQIRNVLGQGPVPTFAPPFIPVGPVVNGSTLPGGGHFF